MPPRIRVLASVVFLLSTLLVFSRASSTGDVAFCVEPKLSQLINSTQNAVILLKEAVEVANDTVHAVKNCVSGTGSSGNPPSSQQMAVCLTLAYTELRPRISNVTEEAGKVEPEIEKEVKALKDCFGGPEIEPTNPSP